MFAIIMNYSYMHLINYFKAMPLITGVGGGGNLP